MLLIVRELASGSMRLSGLQRAFPGLSTGALEQRLGRMAADGIVNRRRYAEVPPRVEFDLTDAGRDLLAVLAPLVRWALRWAWTPPDADEWIDVSAMFRLAGCVVQPPAGMAADVELVVEDDAELPRDLYTLSIRGGGARLLHEPATRADTVITATATDWADALGPRQVTQALRISGDTNVADLFLSSFQE